MKRTLALALLALAVAIPSYAQDETPGQQTTITVAVPATGHPCGHSSYPLYCYGVPVDVGGVFWMDVYYNAYYGPTGFILFNDVLDLGEGYVTAITFTYIPADQPFHGYPATVHIEFNGFTNDGDNDAYSGVADLAFRYEAVQSCSGRGCSRLPIRYIKPGGTLVITYN
jgi:hypothetical protein